VGLPPFAVRVSLIPEHIVSCADDVFILVVKTVTLVVSVVVRLVLSVTVTVYTVVANGLTVMVELVAPFDHAYVYGGVPPLTVAVS
jgi:hypothetical protein